MSAWSELERVALLGTRRERLQIPEIAPALDALLSKLDGEESAHALLSAAGTLDLYEQIGRSPARLKPGSAALMPAESMPPCPPAATQYLARIVEGSMRNLMSEFLDALQERGMRIPEILLPNMLALGYKRSKLRPQILAVMGNRGRWLAAHQKNWHYAAIDPGNWPGIRAVWEEMSASQRPVLVGQLRAVDVAQGRALVESTWRGQSDQQRLQLIRQLANGLSMADEPLLESALDDRSQLVRRQAAQQLAHLPQSRFCGRMVDYVPRYLAWTPDQTRQITVSLPNVSPAMRRNGIVGARSTVPARVRSQEIIQMVSGVPLTYWTDTWGVEPRQLLAAISSTSWPRTLTSGFAQAAVRQNDPAWAWAIIDTIGIVPVTARLVPTLAAGDLRSLTFRAMSDSPTGEIAKDSALITILRRWEGSWDAELAARLVTVIAAHFRVTAEARAVNNLIREVFLKLARHTAPDFAESAPLLLGDPDDLGIWRNTVTEFLRTLRFRHGMLQSLETENIKQKTENGKLASALIG